MVRLDKEAQQNRLRNSELQEAIEFLNSKPSNLLAAVERQQKLRSGSLEESQRRVHRTSCMVSDGKISEVGNELIEASEEIRKLTVDRRRQWRG